MASGVVSDQPVVVRELMPEDLKLEMEQFTRSEAVKAGRYLAGIVGNAHGQQMSLVERNSWARELKERRPADFAAPSWLWSTVVELLARHERAYLEHCRAFVREAA